MSYMLTRKKHDSRLSVDREMPDQYNTVENERHPRYSQSNIIIKTNLIDENLKLLQSCFAPNHTQAIYSSDTMHQSIGL